ncbi:hydroxymethylbilane synthase [Terrisporobacter sp.]|uniref:hydroxymethylbilane synthase n=1 Tax=Terrisporobacter sp. TaxID=1965305 RepID=UPI002611FD12|nr:hydroxymethylbilane synthase [Terrisporobacter sp.]
MKIVVGTRGSKLALVQTNWVVDALKKVNPGIEFEVKVIKTKGDLVTHLPLHKIGDKGLFTKEIEQQLLNKEIDLAVHSMKDMPSILPDGLKFASVPRREDPRDILVLKEGYKTIEDLPMGAKIGTGSKRRTYQLLKYRPDLEIVPIRGNIETRIKKIEDENLDGVVLAAAGLLRAGLENRISYYLPTNIMIPAPAQGALALEIREDDSYMEEIISHIKDEATEIQVAAERGFLTGVNGSCHVPMGAYCEIHNEKLILTGLYGDEDGKKLVVKSIEGKVSDANKIGYDLAKEVLNEYNKL